MTSRLPPHPPSRDAQEVLHRPGRARDVVSSNWPAATSPPREIDVWRARGVCELEQPYVRAARLMYYKVSHGHALTRSELPLARYRRVVAVAICKHGVWFRGRD